MSRPGHRNLGDDLAPTFVLEVEGTKLESDITDYIQTVEFESAADMADMLRVVVENPGHQIQEIIDSLSPPDFLAHKALQPGNEANFFCGYGDAGRPANFVGRAHFAKHLPVFPRDGVPTLEIKGYDRSHLMMDAEGPITGGKLPKLKVAQPIGGADNQGQSFPNTKHSDVVDAIARMHGFQTDIDPTEKTENVIVKKGHKHYELVRGLANLNNRDFWVDYDLKAQRWVLHWKIPSTSQRAEFTFVYGDGDSSTLLEFEPEYGLRDQISTATILIFDAKNQRWVSAIESVETEGPDPFLRKSGDLARRAKPIHKRPPTNQFSRSAIKSRNKAAAEARHHKNVIEEALENAGAFRLAAGGVAIDVLPPGQRFRNVNEAAAWLRRWFITRQDNFIIGHGTVVGVETLRARQVHTLRGLSSRLDGDYYFIKARHKIGDNNIYTTEFVAHKVVE